MLNSIFVLSSFLPACQPTGRAERVEQGPVPEQIILAEATRVAPTMTPELSRVSLKLVDVAETAGINYRWALQESPPYSVRTAMGNGAAFLDFDGDGWVDVLLVGPQPQLYRNLRNGRFARVAAGLENLPKLQYMGVGVGDYDRDGFPDVFLSAYHGGVLLHNEHGQHLRDVTHNVGIDVHNGWTSAVAFADLDRDGWPDLIVGHFLVYERSKMRMCQRNGISFDCGPPAYAGERPQVFRNLGGRFQDMTHAWGFDASSGKNLAVSAVDLDGDGQVEVIMANDSAPGDLFRRKGDRFEDQGIASGTAFSPVGAIRAGMGVTVADFDHDGKLDLAMSDREYTGASLFHNIGKLLYKDVAGESGVKAATFPLVGWGILFADLENNGWPDLLVANGNINPDSQQALNQPFKQPLVLLYNREGKFFNLTGKLEGRAARPIMGRGMCLADYDHDGKLDVLVVDNVGTVMLLHNESPKTGHYLSVRLRDQEGESFGEGTGATVFAEVGGQERVFPVAAGDSYISASESRVHIGLGTATLVPLLTVQWPSGRRERFGPFPADQRIEIREGTGKESKKP